MIKTHKRVGSRIKFLYPKHGRMNILRWVVGVVIHKGSGPNGPYLKVQEDNGSNRNFSTKKMVFM